MDKRLYLEAKIEVHEETVALRNTVASIIDLPEAKDKQPDLLYFTAIFVSSGANLNYAYFQSSELVKAENTIINKALDVEHNEEEIVGHIYERAFISKDGKKLSLKELSSFDTASLDEQEVHVVIAGIVYKHRFPELAEEIISNEWKVSMETYYRDYDVKIGNLIISRNEAETLGLASDESMIGKIAKVIKNNIEIADGEVTRVLRDLVFSGCGFVKKPANKPSIILETAKEEVKKEEAGSKDEIIILDYGIDEENVEVIEVSSDNNLTSSNVEVFDKEESSVDTDVGICVSYKKDIYDSTTKGPESSIIHKDWCTLFDESCTSFSRDTTDPECLRNQALKVATACTEQFIKDKDDIDRRKGLLDVLFKALKSV